MSVTYPVIGLEPDNHPVAKPGSLAIADGITCDLPNQARGRPCLNFAYEKDTGFIPNSIHPFDGTVIVSSLSNSIYYRLESPFAIISGTEGEVVESPFGVRSTKSRENLYLTTYPYPSFLEDQNGPAKKAGVYPGYSPANVPRYQINSAVSGNFNGPLSYGYIVVVKREDSNGYIKYSPPSYPFVQRVYDVGVSAASGCFLLAASQSANSWYFKPGDLVENDEIQFYRSLVNSTANLTVGPDYYLATSYKLTAQDISESRFPTAAGAIILDNKLNEELGQALYTNPTQQGALAAKYPPPTTKEVTTWQGVTFWANSTERARATINLNRVRAREQAPISDGICTFQITGGVATSGSNQITGISNVDGIVVGQYISDVNIGPFYPTLLAGDIFDTKTKITAITGLGPYTLTLNKPVRNTAILTGSNETWVGDVITINTLTGSTDFVAWAGTGWKILPNLGMDTQFEIPSVSGSDPGGYYPLDDGEQMAKTIQSIAQTMNFAYSRSTGSTIARTTANAGIPLGSVGTYNEFQIEKPTNGYFWITSTKPNAFYPPLENPVLGTTFYEETNVNRIWWSMPQEPEAVPLVNFNDIGSESAAILRTIPLGDSLMIFKEDGLYRITGAPPNNWSFDLVDSTCRLISKDAIAVLDNSIYAWINAGIVQISEAGVIANITDGKINTTLFDLIDSVQLGAKTEMIGWEKQKLLLLMISNPDENPAANSSQYVFCYSKITNAWSRWPNLYWFCAANDIDQNTVHVASTNALKEYNWELREFSNERRGYDVIHQNLNFSLVNSGTLFIENSNRDKWVPKIGDWLVGESNDAAVIFGDASDVVYFDTDIVIFGSSGSSATQYSRIIGTQASGSGYTIQLERANNFQDISALDAYEGVPVLIEWLPAAMNDKTPPFSRPVIREAQFSIQGTAENLGTDDNAKYARMVLSVRGDQTSSIPEVVGNPERSTVYSRTYRFGMPRNAARNIISNIRLWFSEINWPWKISGLSLIGEVGSERTRK